MSLTDRMLKQGRTAGLFRKYVLPHLSLKVLRTLVLQKANSVSCFEYQGVQLPYFFHSYNNFRLTCRCVEIPIIKHYLQTRVHDHVLEIGNVSKHYYQDFKDFKSKDTVDKYEVAYDVVNEDILTYQASPKYDFIYSVSTFEHMDSDGGNNPDYVPPQHERFTSNAFAYMNRVVNALLADGGTFVITFPLGQDNCEIDSGVFNQEYQSFDAQSVKLVVMSQIDDLQWRQDPRTVAQLAQDRPRCAPAQNQVSIAILEIIK